MFSCCVLIAFSFGITSQLITTKIAQGEVWSIWLCNHLLTFSCCGDSNPWGTILEKYSFLWCISPLDLFIFKKILMMLMHLLNISWLCIPSFFPSYKRNHVPNKFFIYSWNYKAHMMITIKNAYNLFALNIFLHLSLFMFLFITYLIQLSL